MRYILGFTNENPHLLSDKQRKYLFIKIKQLGLTHEQAKEIIAEEFGYSGTKDIPADELDLVLRVLEQYASKEQGPTIHSDFENF